ncbi:MAG TPA: hypothetical protein VHM26_16500 [Chitinophagaceae bacterium]|jgi:hypothetical protein|nr:hypothetical protein [Chitinophagaceae bacterium]
MKKIKFFLFAILGIAGAISLYSFTSKSGSKKIYTVKTFYYKINHNNQRIEPGVNTPGVEHSITYTSFTDTNNWTEVNQDAIVGDNWGQSYLNSITFNWESTADGGWDSEVTFQEALEDLWNYYETVYPYFGYNSDGNWIHSTDGTIVYFVRTAQYANIP